MNCNESVFSFAGLGETFWFGRLCAQAPAEAKDAAKMAATERKRLLAAADDSQRKLEKAQQASRPVSLSLPCALSLSLSLPLPLFSALTIRSHR